MQTLQITDLNDDGQIERVCRTVGHCLLMLTLEREFSSVELKSVIDKSVEQFIKQQSDNSDESKTVAINLATLVADGIVESIENTRTTQEEKSNV